MRVREDDHLMCAHTYIKRPCTGTVRWRPGGARTRAAAPPTPCRPIDTGSRVPLCGRCVQNLQCVWNQALRFSFTLPSLTHSLDVTFDLHDGHVTSLHSQHLVSLSLPPSIPLSLPLLLSTHAHISVPTYSSYLSGTQRLYPPRPIYTKTYFGL